MNIFVNVSIPIQVDVCKKNAYSPTTHGSTLWYPKYIPSVTQLLESLFQTQPE